MSGIQILIYVLLIYLIIRSFINQKKYKKVKQINDCLEIIDDEDQFFAKIDDLISQGKEEEYIARAEVIKLYGVIIHKRYDMFEDALNAINIDVLIKTGRSGLSIEEEEVCFFYLYLIFPNLLWADGRTDLKNKIEEKLAPYDEKLNRQLVYRLSLAFDDFYENRNDKGKAFDMKIMDGDYADYDYAKALIGIYKDLVNAMLARIYKDEGDDEKYQECLDMVKSFGTTNIGRRWETSLGIYIEPEEIDDDTEKVHAELHEDEENKKDE